MNEIQELKRRIRSEMRQRRRDVTPEERRAASSEICRRLLERGDVAKIISEGRKACVYLATKDEIDLTDFVVSAKSRGADVVSPRWNGREYELASVPEFEKLVAGPMGVLEPPASITASSPHKIGLWIVPGLAFTASGGRLGYGGGWYDRLLSAADPSSVRIGVGYSFQLVDSLPIEKHDCILDVILL